MAESSSSSTASVAIVILVILAIGVAIWFFTQGGGAAAVENGPDVNIELNGGGN